MRRRITWALMYRVKCMGEADLRRLYMYTNILDEIYSRSWWFAVTRSVCAFGLPIADGFHRGAVTRSACAFGLPIADGYHRGAVTRSACACGLSIADSSPNDVGSGMDSYVEEMVGEFLEKK